MEAAEKPLEANRMRKDGPTMLLWRNAKAIELVTTQVLPIVAPITARAFEILEEHQPSSEFVPHCELRKCGFRLRGLDY